jgi:GntR family transcriptional repressor for pyruvate dehydrogenase complex
MNIEPVPHASLPDAVFEQLSSLILRGELASGLSLPAERELCVRLGVNRGALREALERLAQAGLVSKRQGGATTVLDWRSHAGMELLPRLVLRGNGEPDPAVIRSIAEIRETIGADAARLAARRANPEAIAEVVSAAQAVACADPADLAAVGRVALAFWGAVVRASENVAYRLAFNSLRDAYEPVLEVMAVALADELTDGVGHVAVATWIERREPTVAHAAAQAVLGKGTAAMGALADALDGVAP